MNIFRNKIPRSFEETVSILNSQFDYEQIELQEKELSELFNDFGQDLVLSALYDKTSILARSFIQNGKPLVRVNYKYDASIKDKIIKDKLTESLQIQFKKVFPNIPVTKKIIRLMKRLVSKCDPAEGVNLIKIKPHKVNLELCRLYFQRIQNVAKLKIDELSSEENYYDVALRTAEEWPFLASYIHGNSLIKSFNALKKQICFRKKYLGYVKELKESQQKIMEIVIRSFPNRISSHTALKMTIKEICQQGECTSNLHPSDLLLGDEIQRMQTVFTETRCSLNVKKLSLPPDNNLINGNKRYRIGKAPNRTILKSFNILQKYQCAIAAFEMSEIGGFSGIIPTIKRTQMVSNFDHENGELEQRSLAINNKSGFLEMKKKTSLDNCFAISMPFIPHASGEELLKPIKEKLQYRMFALKVEQIVKRFTNIDLKNSDSVVDDNNNYEEEISPFIKLDPYHYEMVILLNILLGSRNAHFGNCLFSDKTIFQVDNTEIMPENNKNNFLFRSIVTKVKITLNQVIPTEVSECKLEDVCPIHCSLLSLPQANKPFSTKTIVHVLKNLHVDNFVQYHKRKKIFNEDQVHAQLERIAIIRDLFEIEIYNEIKTLTPRELFLTVTQNHETYEILKNHFKINDFFAFQLLGKISKEITLNEVAELANKIKKQNSSPIRVLSTLKNRVFDLNYSPCSSEIRNNKYYASALSLLELQELQKIQEIMTKDRELYSSLIGDGNADSED